MTSVVLRMPEAPMNDGSNYNCLKVLYICCMIGVQKSLDSYSDKDKTE